MLENIEKQCIDSNLMKWNQSKSKCQYRVVCANKKVFILELLQNRFIKALEDHYGSSVNNLDAGDIIFTLADWFAHNQYFLNIDEIECLNIKNGPAITDNTERNFNREYIKDHIAKIIESQQSSPRLVIRSTRKWADSLYEIVGDKVNWLFQNNENADETVTIIARFLADMGYVPPEEKK